MAEPTDDAVLLGRAIAAARAELGMKRRQLADAANVSYPYLSELENGTKQGSTQKIAHIAEALGMTHSQLLARAELLAGTEPGAAPAAPVPPAWSAAALESSGRPDRAAYVTASAPSYDQRTMRPLSRPSASSEDLLVERVTGIVRAEIEHWLDTELEPLVRDQVRVTLRRGM